MRAESSRLTAQATELVQAGRKDRALLVLKMRRLREEESQKAEAQLLNVEKLVRWAFLAIDHGVCMCACMHRSSTTDKPRLLEPRPR